VTDSDVNKYLRANTLSSLNLIKVQHFQIELQAESTSPAIAPSELERPEQCLS
jgi:hypothetical protein